MENGKLSDSKKISDIQTAEEIEDMINNLVEGEKDEMARTQIRLLAQSLLMKGLVPLTIENKIVIMTKDEHKRFIEEFGKSPYEWDNLEDFKQKLMILRL